MSTKSKNPHILFHVLLKKLPGANKEELIWEFSNMLTTSLSEFYASRPSDYRKMISKMQNMVSDIENNSKDRTAYMIERALKDRRSAILKRLQKMGVDTTDWQVVNKFMSNPRIAGKTLGEMDTEEMDLLIPKLESILKKKKAEGIKQLTKAVFCKN